MDQIKRRFDNLMEIANNILKNQTTRQGFVDIPWVSGMASPRPPQIPDVDANLVIEWRTSALSLLERVFGPEAATFKRFESALNTHDKFDRTTSNENFVTLFEKEVAIFRSAKSDFDGGFLFDVKKLVHAEVFSNELDQAKHFLDTGFKTPAAVIAGTVLETTLRKLCECHHSLTPADNINRMNDDLRHEGVYNHIVHRQIQGWADVRNAAAHGRPEQVEPSQVDQMIFGIRDFITRQLG